MKINFDATNTNQNTDKVTITQGSIKTQGMGKTDAYALDISGTVMDNSAYSGQGKTAEIMQSAEQGYLAMQQNYMTVMSNFASEEDYAELAKEGYKPGSVDIETIVTVVDEIKAKLAEAGIEIEGYNDDMSYDELKDITGSASKGISIAKKLEENDLPVTKENVEEVEKALEEPNQLTRMSDSAKKYLVTNDSVLSIEQVYRARYSANSQNTRQAHGYYQDTMPGYYSKKADTYDWEQLNSQLEKVIETAGYDVNEETINQAKWLVESGIELTPQTFRKLHTIENMVFPISEEKVLNSIVNAFLSGKPAREADLSENELLVDKAKQLVEDIKNISDDAIRVVVDKEQPVTIRHLMNAMKQISSPMGHMTEEKELSLLTAKRQLEEVRLHMTVTANLRLLKSDYQIDTTQLSELVDELKAREEKTKQILFDTKEPELLAGRSMIYETTRSTILEIPSKPAAVLGKLIWEDAPLTIRSIKEQGDALIKQYEQAEKSYETLMTAPRKDLGDSIKTAFRNVDDILTDMGYELTKANRKAVRILGYNNMEINDENMVKVKDAALTVDRVVEKLTPGATLRLIRDGLNPVEMSVEELDRYLTEHETADEKAEKYSEFLYRLEKSHEITQEERDAYVGIYRLMRQIEKSDGSVIGNLVRQGADLSFRNLLTALRTRQKGGVDYQIDNTQGAGTLTGGITNSISAQIEKYYTRLSQDIMDHLNPQETELLKDSSLSIEKADELLRDSFKQDEVNDELQKEQVQELRSLNKVSEETVKTLMSYDVEMTGDSLLSAERLFANKDKVFEKLFGFEEQEKDELSKAAEQLKEGLTDEETALKAYDEFVNSAEEVLAKAEESIDNRLDLKAVRNVRKILTIASKLAKSENYVVPAEANGEVISVNLQILRGMGENGKVQVTFSSKAFGDVYARFEVKSKAHDEGNETLTGMIACSDKEGLNFLKQSADNMKVQLSKLGIESGEFYFSTGAELKLQKYVADAAQEFASHKDRVSNHTLYQVAKAFLTCME